MSSSVSSGRADAEEHLSAGGIAREAQIARARAARHSTARLRLGAAVQALQCAVRFQADVGGAVTLLVRAAELVLFPAWSAVPVADESQVTYLVLAAGLVVVAARAAHLVEEVAAEAGRAFVAGRAARLAGVPACAPAGPVHARLVLWAATRAVVRHARAAVAGLAGAASLDDVLTGAGAVAGVAGGYDHHLAGAPAGRRVTAAALVVRDARTVVAGLRGASADGIPARRLAHLLA